MTEPKKTRKPESERRLRHNFRLARLLRFLELVSGKGRWNPQNLMKELEVSERTIHRLRETLELAGVPISFSKSENAYRIQSDYRFPPVQLTEAETIGQGAATSLSESEALKLPIGSKSTTRKLMDTSSAQLGRILEDAARLTEVLDLKIADNSQQRGMISTVQQALLKQKMLEANYRSPYEPSSVSFNLHPYRLALIKQSWYLIARPEGEQHPRTYRIVRFLSLRITSHQSRVPSDFDLRAFFGNAWAVYRGDKSYDIELRFTADASAVVLEHTWHHTQQVKRDSNGEATLFFTVDGMNEILRWIIGWGGRVKVIKPPELKELVVEQHRKGIAINTGEN